MKRAAQLFFSSLAVSGLFTASPAFSVPPGFEVSEDEHYALFDSAFRTTRNESIPPFEIEYHGHQIRVDFEKIDGDEGYIDDMGRSHPGVQTIRGGLVLDGGKPVELFSQGGVSDRGQNVLATVCRAGDRIILSVMVYYTSWSPRIYFSPKFFEIIEGEAHKLEVIRATRMGLPPHDIAIYGPLHDRVAYPYFTERRILDRLFDVGVCERSGHDLARIESELKDSAAPDGRTISYWNDVLVEIPIDRSSVTQYNNIAYYLEQGGAYEPAIHLLEHIVEAFPQRTVAYINLGDAYWGHGERNAAIDAYQTYIKLLEKQGREDRAPGYVRERIERG